MNILKKEKKEGIKRIGTIGLLMSGRKISDLTNEELVNELDTVMVHDTYYLYLKAELIRRIT